jgi:hypothetical protein
VLLHGSNVDQQHLDCQCHLCDQLFVLLLLLLLHVACLTAVFMLCNHGMLHSSRSAAA